MYSDRRKRDGHGNKAWHGEGKTNPNFAVQTLLQFLKLLFLVAINSLLSNGED